MEILKIDHLGIAVNSIDEVISNVNLRLSAAQKNEFYGEPAGGMELYTNDDNFNNSYCDEEPDGGWTHLIRTTITKNW